MISIAPERLGIVDDNPFNLPLCERADVALVSADWYAGLELRHSREAPAILRALSRCVDAEVAIEARDEVGLTMPPNLVDRVACVISTGGLYRDRELYNYEIGPRYAGANWTAKRRPRPFRYSAANLDKLRLSVPCFLMIVPEVRRAIRGLERNRRAAESKRMTKTEYAARNVADKVLADSVALLGRSHRRPLGVHCVGALTHPQRVEFMSLLGGFSGEHGLTDLAAAIVLPDGTVPVATATVRAAAAPYFRRSVSRPRFWLNMCRHKVVVAPAGAGELTYRHGEAMAAGAALVCQDLSHIETMFPLEQRHNVMYCRPDLADLVSLLNELLADNEFRRRLGEHARQDFSTWSERWREILFLGFEKPLREVLGGGPRPSPVAARGETNIQGIEP